MTTVSPLTELVEQLTPLSVGMCLFVGFHLTKMSGSLSPLLLVEVTSGNPLLSMGVWMERREAMFLMAQSLLASILAQRRKKRSLWSCPGTIPTENFLDCLLVSHGMH